ncbi:MAG: protein kinase, partial [Bacteroidota bacterium]
MATDPTAPFGLERYELRRRLGRGGMGEVFEAFDTRLARTVALKFLPSSLADDSSATTRFRREAQAVSTLDHPHLCTVYDIDSAPDGRLFIAMAYVDGESLKTKLSRGTLPLEEALGLAAQIADGLGCAHAAGIVHRDV